MGALVVLLLLFPITRLLGVTGLDVAIFYLVILAEVSRSIVLTLRSLLKGMGQFRAEMVVVSIERFFCGRASTDGSVFNAESFLGDSHVYAGESASFVGVFELFKSAVSPVGSVEYGAIARGF